MTAFVFLREEDESASDAVARCALESLVFGPMGNSLRRSDYLWFLDTAYADRGEKIVDTATSCGMYCGGLLIHAQVQSPRKPPEKPGITTWLGVKGFDEDPSWIPAHKLKSLERGDIFYICSDAGSIKFKGVVYRWTHWRAALNGHVGALTRGSGWLWDTAEGGGAPGGTGCRLSATPKDIRRLSKKFQGVWRPRLMRDMWRDRQ